ncbi:DUF2637 domain-containing protein [Streptomyces sp. NPDC021020]|uniref:DUF2637 domain-containing protein n=1 Tax=Streptomyces sp. NPDC021020 TaxID=3365109 RepID=UPI00378E8AD7
MTTPASTTAPVTGWDRLAVIVLGGAGCALSASALMQMAAAIHIRPALCWLYPLVIDGFIAYGIRALLVLRTAPLRARLYVWTLVGTATGVSVWANAVHAVRLNQTAAATGGLQLGDTVVASLSTVAPLALAGAVHLYILIARTADNHRDPLPDRAPAGDRLGQVSHPRPADHFDGIPVTAADRVGQRSPRDGRDGGGRPVTTPTEGPTVTRTPTTQLAPSQPRDAAPADGALHVGIQRRADLAGHPDSRPVAGDRAAATEPVTPSRVTDQEAADRPTAPGPVSDREPRRTADRHSDRDTEQLLEIARSAVRAEDKLTRQVVAQAIRGQKIPLSSDTLTALMAQLRAQRDKPVATSRD